MPRKHFTLLIVIAALPAPVTVAQTTVTFQNGVTMLPGGGLYEGTIDTEFRASAATQSQAENEGITVDQFDGGFQTQAAIRFENLLVSDGGLIPDGLTRDDILFAELRFWVTSNATQDANISFHRVVGPDTMSGEFWEEDDTWASLGGDLIPDESGLLDGDPILRDDVEAAALPDFTEADPGSESEDRLADGLDAGLSAADAIDEAFFRYDATDAVRDWLIDGEPNFGWAISNDTGNGWDFTSSELVTELESVWSEAGLSPENFRPALTIAFSEGPILDVDGDNDVDENDFTAFLDRLAIELDGPIATGAPGDFDFDRDVDLDDFQFFKQNFADQSAMFPPGGGSLAAAAGVVPEPTSGLLGCLAALVVAAGYRRRAPA